jgi:heme A synthase
VQASAPDQFSEPAGPVDAKPEGLRGTIGIPNTLLLETANDFEARVDDIDSDKGRSFVRLFRTLAASAVALGFALAVLGSWVRINGAGMTCPDWPLCNGKLIPSMDGGVWLEWSHRFTAFVEGFVLLGLFVAGWNVRRHVAGVVPMLGALGLVFLVQIGLGAATVQLSNSPLSVMLHWAAAMLLLAVLAALALLAFLEPPAGATFTAAPQALALGLASLLGFVAMCLGAYVSSSFAGLACATFPACNGTLFGASGPEFVQMLHRLSAGAFALAALAAVRIAFARGSRIVRIFAALGGMLTALQMLLGAANVVWLLPTALREAHAANAIATFVAFAMAATAAACDPTRAALREAPDGSGRERTPRMVRSA